MVYNTFLRLISFDESIPSICFLLRIEDFVSL